VINPLLSLRDILSRVTGEEKESSPLPLAGEGLGERVFKGTLSCHCVTSSPVLRERKKKVPLSRLRERG